MDLYERLEELREITRLLIDDQTLLRPLVGHLDPEPSDAMQSYRRCYVRAAFALIEAFVEQHRRLLLDLVEAGFITLPQPTLTILAEIREIPRPDGSIERRQRYLQIVNKIKEVYKAAGHGFGQPLAVTLGDEGWTAFQTALELRNRVTHPKRLGECWITDEDLTATNQASDWFKTLQNEFVRFARAHRNENTVPRTLSGKGQKGNREWALGDGKARGSEGVG